MKHGAIAIAELLPFPLAMTMCFLFGSQLPFVSKSVDKSVWYDEFGTNGLT